MFTDDGGLSLLRNCEIKINIVSLLGSLSRAHHTHLWLFVEDGVVGVVRLQRALLHVPMVEVEVVFEASDLK